MGDYPWRGNGEARQALRRIVEHYGPAALSNLEIMENGLDDQLPNAPASDRAILTAAARAGVASVGQVLSAM